MADSPNPPMLVHLEPIEASIQLPQLALGYVEEVQRAQGEEESSQAPLVELEEAEDVSELYRYVLLSFSLLTTNLSFRSGNYAVPEPLPLDEGSPRVSSAAEAIRVMDTEPHLPNSPPSQTNILTPSDDILDNTYTSEQPPVTVETYLTPRPRFTPTSTGISNFTSFSPTAPKISDITTSRVTASAVSAFKQSKHPQAFADSDEDDDAHGASHPPSTNPKASPNIDHVARKFRYPSSTGRAAVPKPDRVTFASFSRLQRRLLLLVGYDSGLQIWDTTHLDRMRELLNVRSLLGRQEGEAVTDAQILPTPNTGIDSFKHDRPLIGAM